MKKVYAYLLGMWEFRTDFTTYFGGDLIETYDAGRDMAHRLTFRKFET